MSSEAPMPSTHRNQRKGLYNTLKVAGAGVVTIGGIIVTEHFIENPSASTWSNYCND